MDPGSGPMLRLFDISTGLIILEQSVFEDERIHGLREGKHLVDAMINLHQPSVRKHTCCI